MTYAGEPDRHLTPEQSAAYLDRVLTEDERAAVEAHLTTCVECRDEVVALQPLVSAQSRRPKLLRAALAVGAAAAAVVLLLVQPGRVSTPEPPLHRDPSPAVSVQPRSPVGRVSPPVMLAWSPLSQAKRYRVLVYDAEGTILHRAEATDTALALPDSLPLSPGQPYFWKVEADTGLDRWVSSPLVEFSVGGREATEP